jgi:hypothetical protein
MGLRTKGLRLNTVHLHIKDEISRLRGRPTWLYIGHFLGGKKVRLPATPPHPPLTHPPPFSAYVGCQVEGGDFLPINFNLISIYTEQRVILRGISIMYKLLNFGY